jgi:hypothetical protein
MSPVSRRLLSPIAARRFSANCLARSAGPVVSPRSGHVSTASRGVCRLLLGTTRHYARQRSRRVVSCDMSVTCSRHMSHPCRRFFAECACSRRSSRSGGHRGRALRISVEEIRVRRATMTAPDTANQTLRAYIERPRARSFSQYSAVTQSGFTGNRSGSTPSFCRKVRPICSNVDGKSSRGTTNR